MDSARVIENLLYTYADRIDRGDLDGVADLFAHGRIHGQEGGGPETVAAYPSGQTTTDFVSKVYNNVLGRGPDTAGLNYWLGQLGSGAVSKDSFLLAIINGARASTGSAADASHRIGAQNGGGKRTADRASTGIRRIGSPRDRGRCFTRRRRSVRALSLRRHGARQGPRASRQCGARLA